MILFLLIQVIIGLNFTFYQELNSNTRASIGSRYPSFFHDPQKFAQYLGMLSFLFLMNYKLSKRITLHHVILFLVVAIAMLFTGGRSGFIGLGIGFLFLFWFLSIKHKAIILASCLIAVLAISTFFNQLVIFKRSQNFSGDYDFRATIWDEAYNIYTNNPLGIGIGNYQNFVQYYSLDQYSLREDNNIYFFDQPESGYLKILVEFGFAGFLVFCLFIIIPVVKALRAYMNGYKNRRIFFYIAAILSFLVSFTSVYTLSDKRILIIFVSLICLLIASTNRIRNSYVRWNPSFK